MNKYTYMIFDIQEGSISGFGDVYVVYANRAMEGMLKYDSLCFPSSLVKETEVFIYPQDINIINPMIRLCQDKKPWEPHINDYREGGLLCLTIKDILPIIMIPYSNRESVRA